MKLELVKTVNEIIDLLKECNWQSKASWFEEKLDVINRNNEDTVDFISAIKAIKNIIAGMGSFTDLPLTPKKESKISKDEARKMQFDLAEELDALIIKLLNKN